MSEGIVYVLTHPAMEGYVKIGKTGNLEERMRSLNNTSVPGPFQCFYAAKVPDMGKTEVDLHEVFGDKRVHPKREFFNVEPSRVERAIRMVALEDVNVQVGDTEEDIAAIHKIDQVGNQTNRFHFEMLNIPVGAVLTFVGRPEVTCTVVQQFPSKVNFQGQETTVSKAAQEVTGKPYGVNGTLYWEYEGYTLSELKNSPSEG